MVDDDSGSSAAGPAGAAGATGSGEAGGASRSLKTAASALRALRLLGSHPDGLSSQDLGRLLGKSSATARYLINTLCEAGCAQRAGDGRWRLAGAPPWGPWGGGSTTADTPGVPGRTRAGRAVERSDAGAPAPGPEDAAEALLAEAVTELYRRTRQRSYLVRRSGVVVATISDVRGHQGLARLPGLDHHVPPRYAHALAMTKVLLASSPAYLEAVVAEPLEALTDRTVTDPDALRREIADIRLRDHGLEDGEFARGFATIAAPIRSPGGDVTVALGLSTSGRRHETHAEELVTAVVEVAAAAARQWAGLVGCATIHT